MKKLYILNIFHNNMNFEFLDVDRKCDLHEWSRIWYQHGQLHRDGNQPVIIMSDGTQYWYQHGQLHRDGDQPAMITSNGTQHWYQYGQLHRNRKR